MKIIAIIPARGGSKGVKRKNIKLLAGKPLIQYAIEAAHQSRYSMDLVTTTDDEEIATIAKGLKCDVIMRDTNLSDDKALMAPVVKDVLDKLKKQGQTYDVILLLQPTSPFRTGHHIDAALEIMEHQQTDSVISVTRIEDAHPARMYHLKEGKLCTFAPESEKLNRQDLPPLYLRNGLIYTLKTDVFLKEMTFCIPNSTPLLIDRSTAINIDEAFDFELAEFIISRRHNNTVDPGSRARCPNNAGETCVPRMDSHLKLTDLE